MHPKIEKYMDNMDAQHARVQERILLFTNRCDELISEFQLSRETERFANRGRNLKIFMLVMGLIILFFAMVMILMFLSATVVEILGRDSYNPFYDTIVYEAIPTTGMITTEYFSSRLFYTPTDIGVLFIVLSQFFTMFFLVGVVVVFLTAYAIKYLKYQNKRATFIIAREMNSKLTECMNQLSKCENKESLDQVSLSVEKLFKSQESDIFKNI